MNNKPLVSSIIIFLNGEKFIEESIASVFAQTYDNWELLLVDDGSTDGSTEIARRYAKEYPNKVRYLEHEGHQNRGMSATRNLGIKNAKGDYIAFVDDDDIWMPEKLEQQVAIFYTYPEAVMVYGRTMMWHSWQEGLESNQADFFPDLGVKPNRLINPPTLLIRSLINDKTQSPTTCNAIMRREIFDRVGGFEEIFRGMYEDLAFFTKIHLDFPVFVSDQCWAKYRQRSTSCFNFTKANIQKFSSARLFVLNWIKGYLSQKEVKNILIWFLLFKEILLCKHPKIIEKWLEAQDTLIQIGRKSLPAPIRHLLWITIGRNL
jgi:glycosyltransferase involved in cell wall biosynthesis